VALAGRTKGRALGGGPGASNHALALEIRQPVRLIGFIALRDHFL
jgi:hypothetical protein